MKDPPKEYRQLQHSALLIKWFDKHQLTLQMTGMPTMARKIQESRLLIVVEHPTNKHKWFVNSTLLLERQFLKSNVEGASFLQS